MGGNLILQASTYSPSVASYTTNFLLTEDPISEGGRWKTGRTDAGTDWQNIKTTPNRAFAAAFSSGSDDSVAQIITPIFADNQKVTAIIHLTGGYSPGSTHEIQIMLRCTITNTPSPSIKGYEILLPWPGIGGQIHRWNGPQGSAPTLFDSGPGWSTAANGDVIEASITNFTITVKQNGATVLTATDTDPGKISTGQPGFASFVRSGGTPASFCWSQWSATDI